MAKNPSQTRRIAIMIDSIKHGGGAEKNAVALAELLAEAGENVTLVTFYSYENEYPFSGVRHSFDEQPQPTLWKKVRKAVRRLRQIRTFCKTHDITHVVSFLEEANNYTILAKLFLRNTPRLIVSVRNNPAVLSWRRRIMIRFLYPFADQVVSVSKHIQKYLEDAFGLTNVVTIYNPIDVDRVQRLAREPLPVEYDALFSGPGPVFITVGRLHQQKGHVHLLPVFAEFCKAYPEARLVIVGEGPERAAIEAGIMMHSLQSHVHLVGQQNNIYPFLAKADCYICSSLWEGFPNVLLEAAASGLYIISTDCDSGPREIIAPEIFGDVIEYPRRGIGGSLVQSIDRVANVPAFVKLFSDEMMWWAAHQLFSKQKVPIKRFYPKSICENWQDILDLYHCRI